MNIGIFLLAGAENVGLVNPGDLLTFGLSRTIAGDGSTLGATNVPIDTTEKLLQVGPDDTIKYDNWEEVQDTSMLIR